MLELEQKVGQLTQQLEGMNAEREQVKGVADRFQGMEDRMKALLQLSEILSVRYNPFLEHEEPSLFDDRDANAFLPSGVPPNVANVARRSPLAEIVPVEPEDAGQPPATPPPGAAATRPAGADGREADPGHADVEGAVDAAARPADRRDAGDFDERDQELSAVATNATATDATEKHAAETDAVEKHAADTGAMKKPALETRPSKPRAAALLDAPEHVGSTPRTAPQGLSDADAALAASPLRAQHVTVPEDPDQDLEAGSLGVQQEADARAPLAQAAKPPRGLAAPVLRSATSQAELHHDTPAPPRLAYQALCWFERLAQQGDPSEIHLFLEQYCRLGWIPAHHQGWMRALADSIAPRREGLAWADVPVRPDELARLHRQHLRLLDQMFRTGFPDDRPDAWERQATQALGED